MSAGLFGLLDDIAALAKLAAASVDDVGAAAGRASAKAAGVVIDDTAVTPQYVQGVNPKRELPIIKKIAVGSLRNKLFFILPAALLLSQFLPWLLTPILMLGGAYLSYEGAHKIHSKLFGHAEEKEVAQVSGPEAEKQVISGAVRTDFILSAEIMVISLNEVAAETFWTRLLVLIVVAFAITALVYGVVALIVKMDDVGLSMAKRDSPFAQKVGTALVRAMPKVLGVISTVGVAAMLWVGGHILLVGLDDLGLHAPYDLVHHLEVEVHHALGGLGAVAGWIVNTIGSAILGLIVGGIIVAVMQVLPFGKHGGHETSEQHGTPGEHGKPGQAGESGESGEPGERASGSSAH